MLGEHIAGFEVRHDQDLSLSCDRRFDALDARGFGANGIVKGERPIHFTAGDLSAIGHFAKCGGIDR